MTFLYPMGLWALLAIPVILGLHYFRQQKKSRQIGGLHLWDFAQIATPAGGRFDRLLRNLPLLFQILAALLLALLISGFDISSHRTVRHFAVIVDDSISMQARTGGSVAAQRVVEQLTNWAVEGDRFTLVAAGEKADLMAGPTATRTEFVKALTDWIPEAPLANFDEAVNIAVKFSSTNSRILLVTDNPDHALHLDKSVTVLGVGRAAPNNAILFADRFRVETEREKVVATVQGFGGQKRRATITARRGDEVVGSQLVDLETSKPVSVQMELPAITENLQLTLTPEDSLAVDDSVVLMPSLVKPVRVHLPEDLPQRAAFEKAVLSVKDVLLAERPGEAELVFTTETTSTRAARRVYEIASGQTTDTLRVAAGRDVVMAPGSAITRDLSLAGVVWPFDAGQVDADPRLALRADIAYTSIPLLYKERETSVSARYRLNLDLNATNIFRHTAWPVLVLNIIQECRAALPGLARTNLRSGEDVMMNLELQPGVEPVVTLWREAQKQPMQTWRGESPTSLSGLRPGSYILRQGQGEGSAELGRFRVNLFNPGESDLSQLKEYIPDLKALSAGQSSHSDRNLILYYAMLAALIGCVILAWVYHDAGH